MNVYTSKGADNSGAIYIRSAELHDLIMRMSKQKYAPEELANARTVTYYDASGESYAAPSVFSPSRYDGCKTSDIHAIRGLVDVLRFAKRIEERIKVSPEIMLRFSMPDGRILSAFIAKPGQYGMLSPDSPYEGHTLAILGDELYDLDLDEWSEAMAVANLPHKVR